MSRSSCVLIYRVLYTLNDVTLHLEEQSYDHLIYLKLKLHCKILMWSVRCCAIRPRIEFLSLTLY